MRSTRLITRTLGLLAAPALVMTALTAPSTAEVGPADVTETFNAPTGGAAIPDAPGACGGAVGTAVEVPVNVSGMPPTGKLTAVSLTVGLNHSYLGDVTVTLIAPDGSSAVLHDPGSCTGDSSNLSGNYRFNDLAGGLTIAEAAPFYLNGTAVPANLPTGRPPSESMIDAFAHLPNGNGTWTLRVTDRWTGAVGNLSGNVTLQLTHDLTRPDTEITSGPQQGSPAGEVEFEFEGSDNNGVAGFRCSLDGAPAVPCSSPFTADVETGTHSLSVWAVDTSGNVDDEPATYLWQTEGAPDTTAPSTAIVNGPGDGDELFAAPTYTFDSPDDDSATFECSIDGGAYAACTSPYAFADDTALGDHTFAVRAKDAAGNVDDTPASTSFTLIEVDTTAPQTIITDGPANGAGVTAPPSYSFSSPAADAVSFECSVNGGEYTECTSPFTVEVGTAETHVLEVRAVDDAGNVDPTPAKRSFRFRDLCAEVRAKLTTARTQLAEAKAENAGRQRIRQIRAKIRSLRAQVREVC